jgi:transposase-like protein
MGSGLDMKLHLVQHHARMAYMLAEEILREETTMLTGEKYERDKPCGGRYRRWGTNPGSVRIDRERVPIRVPRVRDVEASEERPLESYGRLKEGIEIDDRLEQSILLGLSTRDYAGVAGSLLEGFGLSASSVSRAFQERSASALEAFEQRRLDEETFIGLWIDGKYLSAQQMVICLGLTEDGRKMPLGFVETTTENAEAIKGLFQNLIRQGLTFDEGILCIVDGAKGLSSAVREVFGEKALIQRCQWHKRENVVAYLSEKDKPKVRGRLQRAYELPDYKEARKALVDVHRDLLKLNRSAANSLMEGFEETLTLHRLGVFEELGKSLKTTNAIESLNSQLGKYLRRVKRWMHSDQRQRWVAMGILEAEKRMRRINSSDKLPMLRAALQNEIKKEKTNDAEIEPLHEENFN